MLIRCVCVCVHSRSDVFVLGVFFWVLEVTDQCLANRLLSSFCCLFDEGEENYLLAIDDV